MECCWNKSIYPIVYAALQILLHVPIIYEEGLHGIHSLLRITERIYSQTHPCMVKTSIRTLLLHFIPLNFFFFTVDFLNDEISDDSRCAMQIFNRHGFQAWPGWVNKCRGRSLPDVSRCWVSDDWSWNQPNVVIINVMWVVSYVRNVK